MNSNLDRGRPPALVLRDGPAGLLSMRADLLASPKNAAEHIDQRACSIPILRCVAEGGASKDKDGPKHIKLRQDQPQRLLRLL